MARGEGDLVPLGHSLCLAPECMCVNSWLPLPCAFLKCLPQNRHLCSFAFNSGDARARIVDVCSVPSGRFTVLVMPYRNKPAPLLVALLVAFLVSVRCFFFVAAGFWRHVELFQPPEPEDGDRDGEGQGEGEGEAASLTAEGDAAAMVDEAVEGVVGTDAIASSTGLVEAAEEEDEEEEEERNEREEGTARFVAMSAEYSASSLCFVCDHKDSSTQPFLNASLFNPILPAIRPTFVANRVAAGIEAGSSMVMVELMGVY